MAGEFMSLYGKPVAPSSIQSDDLKIEFDVLVEQEHSLGAEVPEFPVEDGYSVSDHVIIKPLTLTLIVRVSNSPVTWANRLGGSNVSRITDVVAALEEIFEKKKPVTVTTNLKIYENMCIENISLSRNVTDGRALQIPIDFKQIITTETKTAKISDQYVKKESDAGGISGKTGETGQNAGTGQTSNASSSTEAKTRKSLLSSGVSAISSFFGK